MLETYRSLWGSSRRRQQLLQQFQASACSVGRTMLLPWRIPRRRFCVRILTSLLEGSRSLLGLSALFSRQRFLTGAPSPPLRTLLQHRYEGPALVREIPEKLACWRSL